MKIPYFQVDAFASRQFAGNPAGVCPLEEWLPDAVLQNIAMENNQAETAYIVKRPDYWDLRWFTPTVEMDLCGHATLAAAFVLKDLLHEADSAIRFQTHSGILKVSDENDLLFLDFPARPGERCAAPELLVRALGVRPKEVRKARDYLAVLGSETEVRTLQPNMALLEQVDCLGIIVTAAGTTCDFVSRFFAPRAGVPEDPVTGSAHCTLIPYWADTLAKRKLTALQISKRGGELFCEHRGDRVNIGGRAALYLRGEIHLDPAA
ncbi:MAG TPA: PhzF family phenazine biosynthesis protein [Candidatus Limnocylindria bacterium]|nr:PhzF family phenazine biosynthesis protein [Candidatus Limnocylindria bacterium]